MGKPNRRSAAANTLSAIRKPLLIPFVAFALLLPGCNDEENLTDSGMDDDNPPMAASPFADLEAAGDAPRLDRSQSVPGPDSDSGAVRGDVDAHIDSLNDSAAQKDALRQLAASIQRAVVMGQDSDINTNDLRSGSTSLGNAVNCIFTQYPAENAPDKIALIRSVVANTPERYAAYNEFNRQLDGFALSLPSGDTCND